jgi:hypothetical protein
MPKPEELLAKRLSVWLRSEYPNVPFRFDIAADIPLPPHLARRNRDLHGKWTRGYPDLLILIPGGKPLYLELKATKTVPNNDHTRRQARFHAWLRLLGYRADFCCGFEECQKMVLEAFDSKKVRKILKKLGKTLDK